MIFLGNSLMDDKWKKLKKVYPCKSEIAKEKEAVLVMTGYNKWFQYEMSDITSTQVRQFIASSDLQMILGFILFKS